MNDIAVGIGGNIYIGRNAVRELLKSGASVDKILVSGREGSIVALVAEAKKAGIPVFGESQIEDLLRLQT